MAGHPALPPVSGRQTTAQMVQFDRDGRAARVQDEGFITEDPGHVHDPVAQSIGCQVALVHAGVKGAFGVLMTNRVKSVFAGRVYTSTCIF